MAHSLTHAIAVCCVISSIGVSLSQEPARQDQRHETGADGEDSCRVRAHMRRVQASFDENNDAVWFQLAFVATVTEVRPLKETDKLTGTLADDENEVAVLRIHAVASSDHATLKEDKIIVCPVGKLHDRWLQWREQKTEMLFEYNRIGKREFVQKFGC